MAAEVVAEVRTVAAEVVDRMRPAVRAADMLLADMRLARPRRVGVVRRQVAVDIGGIRFVAADRMHLRGRVELVWRRRRILVRRDDSRRITIPGKRLLLEPMARRDEIR
jgi:hypothetical protein